jgi:microcystin degradation protein MlrC
MSHESNTFNPVLTTLDDFQACGLHYGAAVVERFRGTDTELGGFLDRLEATGAEPVGAVAASAIPSGPIARAAYEHIVTEILAVLRRGPIDGVLLALHGAMVTEDGEASELGLLRALRAEVGPTLPIVCTLDLHTNGTKAHVELATALLPYNTNPHIDQRDRGHKAAGLLLAVLDGAIHPVSALAPIPLLLSPLNQDTTYGPMAEVVAAARAWEHEAGILNVGTLFGFPFADVPDAGFSVVAIADADRELAERAARSVADVAWRLRERFPVALPSAVMACERAQGAGEGPVVIAEVADNVNAGATADGTHLLRELLARPVGRAAFAAIADPHAVQAALAAGVGSWARITVGGRGSPLSGPPVTLDARLRVASDGWFLNIGANNGAGMLKGFPVEMGRTVVLHVGDEGRDLSVLVSERRVPPIGPEMFRSVGIEPSQLRVVAVKTRGHYWRPYPFVREIVEIETPGLAPSNLATLPYRRLRRPKFPLDPMP